MTVNDEEYGMRPVVNQPFQEIDEYFTVEFALDQHESQGTPRRNRGDHVATEPGTGGGNYGGLTSNCPRLSRMKIGTYPSLVSKKDVCLLLLRNSPNLRIFHLDPMLYLFGILLKGTPQRFLRAKAKLIQEPAYRCLAQTNVELPPNQFRDHDACPQSKGKLHLPRILLRYRVIDPLHHFAGQLWWTAATLPGIQGSPSSLTIAGQPAKQCRFLYPQHLGYQRRWLAFLNSGYSTLPQLCQFLVCQPTGIVVSHTSITPCQDHIV